MISKSRSGILAIGGLMRLPWIQGFCLVGIAAFLLPMSAAAQTTLDQKQNTLQEQVELLLQAAASGKALPADASKHIPILIRIVDHDQNNVWTTA